MKQYFEKIKLAENPVGKRENLSVDKDAAARIIKAGLVRRTWSTQSSIWRAAVCCTNLLTSLAMINTISKEQSNKLKSEQRLILNSDSCQRK